MSGTRNQNAYLPASPIVVDAPNGEVRVEWRHFFDQLWQRTGVQVNGVQLTSSTGPTITAGPGAPTSVQPNSSLWLRTDGATGSRLYVSAGAGTWHAVSGV